MKHPILRYGVALLTLSLAATTIAAADPDTLFPSNQWGVSIFGEYDTGDIHLSNTPGTETHTTTFHYTIPAPPTGVISVSVRSASRTAAAPLKPAASHTPAATIDPTVTTTHTHHYHFNDVEHNPGGGGVQLSYYFSRYAGVAVEGDFLGGSTYLTQLSGQFILRYPFEFGRTSIAGYSKDAKDVRTDSKDSKDYKSAPSEMSGPTWGVARTPSLAVVANGTAAWSASRMSAAVLNFASRSAGESSPMPAGTSATAASISLRSAPAFPTASRKTTIPFPTAYFSFSSVATEFLHQPRDRKPIIYDQHSAPLLRPASRSLRSPPRHPPLDLSRQGSKS